MYEVVIVYKDYSHFDVEVPEEEFESFAKAVRTNEFYMDSSKKYGFWLPLEEVRAIHFVNKQLTPQKESQSCQNQNSAAEDALPV